MGRVDFSFVIDDMKWVVKHVSHKTLLSVLNESGEQADFVYGFCEYPTQTIYLNSALSEGVLIRTFIHELTHCWLWSMGNSGIEEYTTENVCNILFACFPFMERVVSKYRVCQKISGAEK